MEINKKFILAIVVLVLLNIFLLHGILFSSGVIINRDFNFPLTSEKFISSNYPLWNDVTSQTNIEPITRLPLRIPFLILASFGVSMAVITKLIIFFAYLTASISMYLFLNYLFKEHKSRLPLSLFGGIFFAYSLPMLQFMGGISLVYSIGILPLLFLIFMKYKETKSPYLLIVLAGLLVLSAAHPFLLLINSLLLTIYIFYFSKSKLDAIKSIVIIFVIFMALFSWFILPYMNSNISSVGLGRPENLDKSTFELVSDNHIYKILFLDRDKFTYIKTDADNIILNALRYVGMSLILVISSLSLFFRKKADSIIKARSILRKHVKLLFFLAPISFILALGSKTPIGDLYYYAVSSFPLGWIFRSPLKFQLYQAFAISMLFIIGLFFISKKLKNPRQLLAVGMILFIAGSGFAIYNANYNDMNAINLPEEYYVINNILKSDTDNYKVMWYPKYNEIPTTWANRSISPFDIISSEKDTFSTHRNYNYLNDNLYDDIYPNYFQKPEFYDYLRAIGIGYIVFHNDRGYAIDDVALDGLKKNLDSNSIIYESNNWYLFKLDNSTPRVYGHNKVFLSDRLELSNIGAIVFKDSNLTSQQLNNIEFSDAETNLKTLLLTKNLVTNPSFENINQNNKVIGWEYPEAHIKISNEPKDSEHSIEVLGNQIAKNNWVLIKSAPIEVLPKEKVLIEAHMKYYNINGSHIKVEVYNAAKEEWELINFLTLGVVGDSDWKQYQSIIKIPEEINKIRIVLSAGGINDKEKDGATFFDLVGIYLMTNEPQEDFIKADYTKISPTKWKVKTNHDKPFMLVFTETYDSNWKAHINGKEYSPVLLYGVVNGFWIDQTGELDITIEYELQKWFYIGAFISIMTLLASFIYSIYSWRKKKIPISEVRNES